MTTTPDTDPDPVLRLDRVSLHFGQHPDSVTALHEVSLTVAPGEMVAITGRSGSGKSSLLNVAGGLTDATSGTVTVQGQSLTDRSAKAVAALRRHHIGYVFQDLNLLPNLSAVENVSLPMELAGQARHQAEAAATAALERVGLGAMGARFPNELSGGQRQRVAIARGVVGQRSLLLADEPTSALDDVTGEQILQLLRQQCDDGAAALLVTHEPSLA
ncbi:MAG: ABC transporter ATP-binding protein, partial [Actinomycetota bacterium]